MAYRRFLQTAHNFQNTLTIAALSVKRSSRKEFGRVKASCLTLHIPEIEDRGLEST